MHPSGRMILAFYANGMIRLWNLLDARCIFKKKVGMSEDEDSDEELKPSSGTKRGGDDKEGDDEQPPTKKSKTEEDSE